jgi:3-hydroxy-9,10-secoandrosta-1,3,5(10)-triene-9,17-dione monooxygenase
VLTGLWKFASGVDFADWIVVGANHRKADSVSELVACMVPRRDFEIIDTWFVGGLRATGSKDVAISAVFVPEHRTVPLAILTAGNGPGIAVNSSHIYRLPLLSVFAFNISTPALGVACGVIEQYLDRARAHVIDAGNRATQLEANQLHVAEAAVMVDCATALLTRDCEELNRVTRAGIPLTVEQDARYHRDCAYAAQLCMRAADIIHYLSGAHSLFEENPLQRAFRDIHAINAHLGNRWDRAALAYGQHALGVENKTRML